MSFFGMSKEGKDARNQQSSIAGRQIGQAQNWWDQSAGQLPIAGNLQQWQIDQLMKRFGQGYGTPGELRATGLDVMPGVDEAIARRGERTAGIRDAFGNIPGAGDVSSKLNTITDEYGNTITGGYDDAETAINAGFGGMRGRADSANRDIVGNIGDSYDAATKNAEAMTGENRGSIAGAYGRIGKDIGDTYGGVDSLTGQAFGKAESTLARLDPNGEFRAARVGRAYAPAAASAALRLRQAGIDPTSLEGNAALQRVDASRARGMDDAYADENQNFVSQANALTLAKMNADRSSKLGRLDASTGASERGLGRDLGVAEGWKKDLMDLTLSKGKDFRSQVGTQRDIDLDLARGQMNATIGNQDKSFARGQDYYNTRRGDAMTGNQLAVDQWGRTIHQAGTENQDDLMALQLKQQQYDQGVAQRNRELGLTGEAIGQVGQAGRDAYGNAIQAGQMGGQYAGAANQGYGNIYGNESANANWGAKLIGGIAGPALGAVAGKYLKP